MGTKQHLGASRNTLSAVATLGVVLFIGAAATVASAQSPGWQTTAKQSQRGDSAELSGGNVGPGRYRLIFSAKPRHGKARVKAQPDPAEAGPGLVWNVTCAGGGLHGFTSTVGAAPVSESATIVLLPATYYFTVPTEDSGCTFHAGIYAPRAASLTATLQASTGNAAAYASYLAQLHQQWLAVVAPADATLTTCETTIENMPTAAFSNPPCNTAPVGELADDLRGGGNISTNWDIGGNLVAPALSVTQAVGTFVTAMNPGENESIPPSAHAALLADAANVTTAIQAFTAVC